MVKQINLGNISLDVIQKDIKNIHLSVYPPTGRVRISAPKYMNLDTIRVFAISKLDWIKEHQKKMVDQERELPREYLNRESHYVWGKRYLLQIIEKEAPPQVELKHNKMILQVRPGADKSKMQQVIHNMYRKKLKDTIPAIISKWERFMDVQVEKFIVRRMKTRWGSCIPQKNTIMINLELGKKPSECLEYIVVHEMTHLLEPTHNQHFKILIEQFMPKWKFYRDELNRLPVSHQNWHY
jgi:hypothetical protein